MKLELISFVVCPFVHRAAIMLREKNVPFDRKNIDLKNKPDWFLAISPRGKVPVLVADGIPIFESLAILEFLDETHPPRLMPDDPFQRARERGWLEVVNDLFLASYKTESARTAEEFETKLQAMQTVLGRFEVALDAGLIDKKRLGMIAVAAAPAFYRMMLLKDRWANRVLASLPRVREWAEHLASHPSVVSAAPRDFHDELTKSMTERGSWIARAS